MSKAFDTVDHSILLKKLQLYGITDKNLTWFQSYLSNRKQYIEIGENSKTDPKYVTCGILLGFILAPLLFLIYVNDLPNVSRLLDPIMFVDDTNLFFNHKDIKHLFTVVNTKLVNIKVWFTANKLSLNMEKNKNTHSSISQVRKIKSLFTYQNGKVPDIFLSKFLRPSHYYGTSFSRNNYIVPFFKLTKSTYRITVRTPKLCSIILNIEEKLIEKHAIFKATIKTKLVLLEKTIVYF